jgi:hypothetical protein
MKPREWSGGGRLPWTVLLGLLWRPLAVCFLIWASGAMAADLVIRIPGDLSQQDGFYRLDYRNG